MNKKTLKKVIKEMVRESLTEIFAEMKLESIVERVLVDRAGQPIRQPVNEAPRRRGVPSVAEVMEANQRQPEYTVATARPSKKDLLRKIGVDDSTWDNVYGDIDTENNPIVLGQEDTSPEHVPEEVLEAKGLMKDYSAFLPGGAKQQVSADDQMEMEEREAMRKKILAETIGRR